MQLRVRHIARNVFSNWLATAALMGVGFFLSPYIVHHLGNEAYGVWVLAMSSINYLAMLDLGMRSSVLRFVSKARTVGDHEAASDAVSGALWVRLQISVLVLVLSAGLAFAFPILFHVPPALASSARLAVMIIGLNMAIGMSMGVFGGVLSGLNRYDMQTAVTMVQLVIRVFGAVFALRHGYGIVAIAVSEFCAVLVSNVLLVTLARRLYPELRITFKKPQTDVLRALWSYSVYAFMTTVALQLIYQTDNLVVGRFISTAAVTFYSIGNTLCRYTDQFAGAMTQSFVPAASTYEAAGDTDRLRTLYRVGTRTTLAISLPILVTLLVRGRTFISLWMGAQYAQSSGTVLMILASALVFSLANTTALAIAFGTERHKTTAKWALGEGAANLILSVILVRRFGIYGVAIGTLLPDLFVHLVLWPRYISKLVGLSAGEVIGKVWSPMLLAAVPFAIVSFVADRQLPPHSLASFVLETLGLLPFFLITVATVFRAEVRTRLWPVVRGLFAPKTSITAP